MKLEDADNLEEVTAYKAGKEKDEKDPKKLKTEGPWLIFKGKSA